jgi:uncharacterized protein
MIHLTAADYRHQPWANGRGTTIELYRVDRDGQMLARFSMAAVIEDGPFSIFPGVDRNLTVLSGPGFTLQGNGLMLEAKPLVPIAFPGDVAVTATNVTAPSDDFNVMTARSLPLPEVRVIRGADILSEGGLLVLLSLGNATINGTQMAQHDLILLEVAAIVTGPLIFTRIPPAHSI